MGFYFIFYKIISISYLKSYVLFELTCVDSSHNYYYLFLILYEKTNPGRSIPRITYPSIIKQNK
jgi:hypothetical protein